MTDHLRYQLRVNGKERVSPRPRTRRCSTCCATSSTSPARRSAARKASAAPAPSMSRGGGLRLPGARRRDARPRDHYDRRLAAERGLDPLQIGIRGVRRRAVRVLYSRMIMSARALLNAIRGRRVTRVRTHCPETCAGVAGTAGSWTPCSGWNAVMTHHDWPVDSEDRCARTCHRALRSTPRTWRFLEPCTSSSFISTRRAWRSGRFAATTRHEFRRRGHLHR
jgi:hypothetical protein